MAADQGRLKLVFVERNDTASSDRDQRRAKVWAWVYWCLVAATFALLICLGFLA
jgi:hypothetical protein